MENLYVLPNGREICVVDSYQGRYINAHIKREYLNGDKKGEVTEADIWKDIECKKVERLHTIISKRNGERYEVKDTYVIAEKKDWKEYPLDIDYYVSDRAMNCNYKVTIEVILQEEYYKRRLLITYNDHISLFDYVSHLPELLWDELCENKHKYYVTFNDEDEMMLEFYTDDGEYEDICIETPEELAEKVISVRIVEYNITEK